MREADVLAATYTDKAKVIRKALVDTDGLSRYEDKVIYSDLACALSMSQGSTSGETDTVQRINYVAKLFTRPEADVKAGDVVEVLRQGEKRTYKAGESVIHASHIEVPLIRAEIA